MLTPAKLSSASDAAAYYSADDYYMSGQGASSAEWMGQGAASLGLVGKPVDPDVFHNILAGTAPDGSKLGQIKDNGKRTPGWDFTFSPAKSVSLMAMVGGDERIFGAHNKAVTSAMAFAEKRYAVTRVSKAGGTRAVQTGNLIITAFRHFLSREADPLVHTHCVFANATKRPDGKWGALDSRPLHKANTVIGYVYNNALARELKQLGYKIERSGKYGSFEIAGIDRELITRFSKRHDQVENHVETAKHDTPKSRASAALLTRPAKQKADPEALRSEWKERASDKLQLMSDIREDALERAEFQSTLFYERPAYSAGEAVDYAFKHLEERSAVFDYGDLIRHSLDHSFSNVSVEEITHYLDKMEDSGALIVDRSRPVYLAISKTMLEAEKQVEHLATEGLGTSPMQPTLGVRDRCDALSSRLGIHKLSDEQIGAVETILNASARTVAVQGDAGTGKTSALKFAAMIAQEAGYTVKSLAPTHAARKELAGAGLEADTLAAFDLSDLPSDLSKTILFVDESSMIGTRQAQSLLTKLAENPPARLVFIGDTKQLEAIEAGQTFAMLQKRIETASLSDIKRQKEERYNKASRLAAKGDLLASLKQLGRSVVETERANLIDQSVEEWSALRSETGTAPLIVTATHAVRRAVHDKLRQVLTKDGTLMGQEHHLQTYRNVSLTKAEMQRANSYQSGDRIRFISGRPSQGFERGTSHSLLEVDQGANELTLKGDDGKVRKLRLGGAGHPMNLAASRPLELAVKAGEHVRLLRSIKSEGRHTNDEANVTKVDEKYVHLRFEGEAKSKAYPRCSQIAQSLDHAYSSTTHAAQGKTARSVIAIIDTHRRASLSLSQFYTQITRGQHAVRIVTDDVSAMRDMLNEESAPVTAMQFVEALEKTKQAGRPVGEDAGLIAQKQAGSLEEPSGVNSAKSGSETRDANHIAGVGRRNQDNENHRGLEKEIDRFGDFSR